MGRATVLLCDDAADVRLLLSSQLRSNPDIEIVGEAKDGVEAVDLVGRLRPNLVLLDVTMPLLDGLDALVEIKRVSPETRVIVLSNYARERMEGRALALGAESYVEKGASQNELLAVVRDVIAQRFSRPGTAAFNVNASSESSSTHRR